MNCPECHRYFDKKQKCIDHIERFHSNRLNELGMDAAQWLYASTHNGSIHGTCICGCGKDTEWNYKTGKPFKLSSDPNCKKRMYAKAEENMKKARGVSVHDLLRDTDHQREMQKHRHTHGYYKFTDGGEVEYLSSLEQRWLKFCDQVMEFSSNMITVPPEYFEYYDSKTKETRTYMPDYYLPDYNLIVEIKDAGNENPAFIEETKYKVAMKDAAMRNQNKYNYIRINGTNYGPFVELLYHIVHDRNGYKPASAKASVRIITESSAPSLVSLSAAGNVSREPRDENDYNLVVILGKAGNNLLGIMQEGSDVCVADSPVGSGVSEFPHDALAGYDVRTYKYIGDPDMGEIYKTASDLTHITESSISIHDLLTDAGVYYDIPGTPFRNNMNRQSMFIKR